VTFLGPAKRLRGVEVILQGKDTPGRDIERAFAEDAYQSLAAFTQQCWHVLEPGRELEWGWHLDLICRTLEQVTTGDLRNVVICVPPGFAKSLLASVFWPAWWWLRKPTERFLTLSSSDAIATRDSRRMREVVRSPWYQRLVAHQVARGRVPAWDFAKDQDEKVRFENTLRGGRFCFATGGSITGERGDGVLIDDPHQVKDVLGSTEQVAAALGKAHEKVDVVLPSRVNDRRTAWRVTIMQRVHQDDVAGRQLADPAVHKVVLPMHAFGLDHPWRHPEDPRAPGELLDPVRMPEEIVQAEAEKLERSAPGQARAQHEQEPIAASGGTFQRSWMGQRYTWDPQRPPKPYTEIVATVDATFKEGKGKGSAYVSIQVWGRIGWTAYYLLDEVHERLSYVATRQACRDIAKKWRLAAMLVEEKANGAALIDDLKSEIPCVVAFVPDRHGDKVARAQLSTPMWQAGGVWLPEPSFCPWVGDYCNELAGFPAALLKDRIDAMSQLFLWWRDRRGTAGDGAAVMNAMAGLLAR
jgi:predicted phage terminase large subunit-like protein